MDFVIFAVDILPILLSGAWITLQIVAIAIVIGFFLGVLLSLFRLYGDRVTVGLAVTYVEIFRGTPLLVQLFILYYGLPQVGIYMSAFWAAVVGMGLNSAAYQAEYFRAAAQSIPSGQMLAARAIGLRRSQAVLSVIVPQTLRRALPSWSNELMYMIKYSSVAYIIQTPELMAAGKEIASKTFMTFETYIVVAFIYLIFVIVASRLLKILENKVRVPGM